MTFYRKYRPKNLSEILGHETTVQILKNAAKTGRISHAYLLHGGRGTGKTSTARILAKLINCQKRDLDEKFKELGEPCNECSACQEIEAGRALDVIEIDAASNRGIDEIRNLKENVRLSPSTYKYKVFIIDEVHMLTTPAFNALLKTLEEPPSHAVLILATTELEKVPSTIISRTQKFTFKKIPRKFVLEKLISIATEEKIKIAPAGLELIAEVAEGSFRDAESLFDQVVSLTQKNGEISLEQVESVIGQAGSKKISELLRAVFKAEMEVVMEVIGNIKENGYDIVQFNKDLINYLEKVVTLRANPKMVTVFQEDLTEEEFKTLQGVAELGELKEQINLIKSLIEAYRHMRYSPFPAVPLEVALIEFIKS